MGAAKPTMGYPTRTDAVIAFKDKGWTDQKIADKIGIAKSTVSALIASRKLRQAADGRHGLIPADRGLFKRSTNIAIKKDALEKLRPAAESRSITIQELVRRMVCTIAEDGLTDAILDDGAAT